jgi:AraC-like DNA-binding protein
MERSREENAAEAVRKVRVSDYVVSDAEAYSESVAGVDIEGVRAEPGHGPTRVLVAEEDRFTSTSCRVGFPMLNRTTVDDDRLLLASVARAAPGSRWCEFDLEPGAVFVYGPGADHTAINRPGLDFTFVAAAPGRLEAIAEELSLSIEVPERGSVERIRPSAATSSLLGAFLEFRGAAARCTDRTGRLAAEVLPAVATFLSGAAEDWRKPTRRPIDRRHIVFKSIDYAETIGRVPSLGELCALTHVSQRSLRRAFISEFDVPPTQFFRTWALGKAHSRLRDADDGSESVTGVALGLGFTHLSRFAGHYQRLYGEMPSTTLASRPALASSATQSFPR